MYDVPDAVARNRILDKTKISSGCVDFFWLNGWAYAPDSYNEAYLKFQNACICTVHFFRDKRATSFIDQCQSISNTSESFIRCLAVVLENRCESEK